MTSPPSFASLAVRFGTGCAGLVLLFGALAAASHHLMTPAVANPDLRLGIALASSLFLATGLASFWSLLRGHGRGEASRSGLLRRARSGEAPPDGGPIVATGLVRPLAAPLVAPLSATPCVAYAYRLYREGQAARGKRAEIPVYWGYASRAFALDGPSGRSRVLAVPRLLQAAVRRGAPDDIERARRLVAATTFEAVSWDGLGVVGTALTMATEILTDDDGEVRRHWKRADDSIDPADLILEETVLPVGEQASVHGTWSAERGAIVALGDPSLAAGVSATPGPPENLDSVLPPSTSASFATAAISTLLGAGIVWFALEILPSLI